MYVYHKKSQSNDACSCRTTHVWPFDHLPPMTQAELTSRLSDYRARQAITSARTPVARASLLNFGRCKRSAANHFPVCGLCLSPPSTMGVLHLLPRVLVALQEIGTISSGACLHLFPRKVCSGVQSQFPIYSHPISSTALNLFSDHFHHLAASRKLSSQPNLPWPSLWSHTPTCLEPRRSKSPSTT